MRIRDTRIYVESYCGSTSIDQLGTNKEPFLIAMHGVDPNLDAVISEVANFANNAEEQLFYEFVQNAFDAKANALMFYANEDYLIVLNNGVPFYTDPFTPNSNSSNEERLGQLYNFLAKGKSKKFDNDSQMGQYGQGSKLMYTLLVKESGEKNKNLLIDTIKKERKGPYLISWNSRNQLEELLMKRNKWSYIDPSNDKDGALVFKILMSYYPILPGLYENLFSSAELDSAIDAFDELVNPRRNINRLYQGTALIIPLGKGKFDLISKKRNIDNVKVRLSAFAAVTAGNEKYLGKQLNYISVLGNEVETVKAEKIDVDFKIEGSDFHISFAFNKKFSSEESVNFYKGLPILDTKYGLGFIIDSADFELEGSRQRLQDNNKTSLHLKYAFEELVKKLDSLKETDPKKFDIIYDAILNSAIPSGADYDFLRVPFEQVFIEYLRDNIRTLEGTYENFDNVFCKDFNLGPVEVDLAKLGIQNRFWVDPYCKNLLEENFNIILRNQILSFRDLIEKSPAKNLAEWISNLSFSEYEIVHGLSVKFFPHVDNEHNEFTNKPLFKSRLGNIYTYNDLIKGHKALIIKKANYNSQKSLLDTLVDLDYLKSPTNNVINGVQLEYLKKNIEYFRKSSMHKKVAMMILGDVASIPNFVDRIKSEIYLFENQLSQYKPFADLFIFRPEGTILFDDFRLKGTLPDNVKPEWFINTNEKAWEWIRKNLDVLKSLNNWDQYSINYLKDIKNVFSSLKKDVQDNSGNIRLNINEEGRPVEDEYSIIAEKVTDSEYQELADLFPNVKIVTPRFRDILSQKPFNAPTKKLESLIYDGFTVDEQTLKKLARINVNFIKKFAILPTREGQYIFKSLISVLHNFKYSSPLDKKCGECLEKGGYRKLPKCIYEYIQNDDLDPIMNYELMIEMLDRCENIEYLLPLVKECSSSIHSEFVEKLPIINVTSNVKKDNINWLIIEFIGRSENRVLKDKLLEKLRCNSEALPDKILNNKKYYNGHLYDLFKLLPELSAEDALVKEFLNYLPNSDQFKKNFYDERMEQISEEDIYEELESLVYLSVVQLEFCLDYCLKEKLEYDIPNLKVTDYNLQKALEMVSNRQFKGFDKYMSIPGYRGDKTQVLCDNELLLEMEKLPFILQQWLKEESNISLMTSLITSKAHFVNFRKSIYNDEPISFIRSNFNNGELERTLEWISAQDFDIPFKSNRYNTLKQMIVGFPKGQQPLYLLKFTGRLAKSKQKDEAKDIILHFEKSVTPCYYLTFSNWRTQSTERFEMPEVINFLTNNNVYLVNSHEFLEKHGLDKNSSIIIEETVNSSDEFKEWEDPIYNQWKEKTESYGIRLYLSNVLIPLIFSINLEFSAESQNLLLLTIRSKEYGYNRQEKKVVIKYPANNDLSEIKLFSQYSSKIDFFTVPCMELVSMFLDRLEKWERLAKEKGIDILQLLSDAVKEKEKVTSESPSPTSDGTDEAPSNPKDQIKDSETGNDLGAENHGDEIAGTETEEGENVNTIPSTGVGESNQSETITVSQTDKKILEVFNTLKEEDKQKLIENSESLSNIVEKLDVEQIKTLAEDPETLVEILEEKTEAEEEEEKESAVRMTIGYIGELIYQYYLQDKKNKEYEYAAENGIGEYDFFNKTDDTFIDVKTTLYSLKDGVAPFYIHRSQNVFMQQNPDKKFRIVRISLKDLQLQKSYEKLRDKYGKEANPQENKYLKKECQKLAKDYWRSAEIKEFEDFSPEYGIKIAKQTNR